MNINMYVYICLLPPLLRAVRGFRLWGFQCLVVGICFGLILYSPSHSMWGCEGLPQCLAFPRLLPFPVCCLWDSGFILRGYLHPRQLPDSLHMGQVALGMFRQNSSALFELSDLGTERDSSLWARVPLHRPWAVQTVPVSALNIPGARWGHGNPQRLTGEPLCQRLGVTGSYWVLPHLPLHLS